MQRNFQKLVDNLIVHKYTVLGICIGGYFAKRMSNNMNELEQNTAQKKLFDPTKAKAQIEVYKEIYRLEAEEGLTEDEKREIRKKDGALKIL